MSIPHTYLRVASSQEAADGDLTHLTPAFLFILFLCVFPGATFHRASSARNPASQSERQLILDRQSSLYGF